MRPHPLAPLAAPALRRLAALLLVPVALTPLMALWGPTTAAAATCPNCAVLGPILASVANRGENVVNNHITMDVGLTLAALGTMTQQLSTILLKQVEAEEAMRTGEQKLEAKREREVKEFEAKQTFMRQPRTACITGTASVQVPGGQRIRRQMQSSINRASLNYDTNGVAETAADESATASARLAERKTTYCSQVDADRQLCDQPVEERLQDADINAATLLDNGTLDPEMQAAAQDLCTNLMRPVPPKPIAVASSNTAAGEIAQVRRLSYDSRISLARQVCTHMIAQQTQTMDLKEWAEAVDINAEDIDGGDGDSTAEGLSIYDLMRIEITRRYGNPNWVTETLGRDALPINLEKEMAMMIGLSLFLDWERYELERRTAVNLAAMVASSASEDFYTVGNTRGGSIAQTIQP